MNYYKKERGRRDHVHEAAIVGRFSSLGSRPHHVESPRRSLRVGPLAWDVNMSKRARAIMAETATYQAIGTSLLSVQSSFPIQTVNIAESFPCRVYTWGVNCLYIIHNEYEQLKARERTKIYVLELGTKMDVKNPLIEWYIHRFHRLV